MSDRLNVIALLGAESTGKTALAQALAERLARDTGLRTAWVPEVLREWCEREGRTPRADEQAAIALAQQRRIEEVAAAHDLVVADTTPLMTAVYSEYLFDDRSLHAMAADFQRRCAATLLTALDLPWVADAHLRDGAQVRAPVDRLVRGLLLAQGLSWSVVHGAGEARLEHALDALSPWLRTLPAPRAGLFTRLQQREAAQPAWQWVCEDCDDPQCEHALRATGHKASDV
ncbi:AAA family ATPase [Azohydromonas caseinilytica]|uniref:ATP-binding protein n=1 Tax=Azohydromonas caseinilytica TaxID=2728836 RepID=A0A848F5J7_9BURK|nr:ATP-binding protein [Azohydromonas caseinilytica]NML14672.1 ATP-binding protein [Azohydromonas caseinilytica]